LSSYSRKGRLSWRPRHYRSRGCLVPMAQAAEQEQQVPILAAHAFYLLPISPVGHDALRTWMARCTGPLTRRGCHQVGRGAYAIPALSDLCFVIERTSRETQVPLGFLLC